MFESLFSRQGFSPERLRCLLEVHDAGSIARAAPDNPGRQSQYSRQLRELSEFFGCELAKRSGKVMKLTPQGVELTKIARRHFTELDDFIATCSDGSAEYVIAAGDSLVHWLVIPRLGKLYDQFPRIRLSTLNLRTKQIVQQVEDGRVHFGLVRSDVRQSGLRLAALGQLEYSAIIPKSLAAGNSLPVLGEVLDRLPFAGLISDGKFGSELRKVFADIGCSYRPRLECESFPQLLQAVDSGIACAVLPKLALNKLATRDHWIVDDPKLRALNRKLTLVWSPRLEDIRSTARQVREAAVNVFADAT